MVELLKNHINERDTFKDRVTYLQKAVCNEIPLPALGNKCISRVDFDKALDIIRLLVDFPVLPSKLADQKPATPFGYNLKRVEMENAPTIEWDVMYVQVGPNNKMLYKVHWWKKRECS